MGLSVSILMCQLANLSSLSGDPRGCSYSIIQDRDMPTGGWYPILMGLVGIVSYVVQMIIGVL